MHWYRVRHGAPFDPKWTSIALRSNSKPGIVWAIFTALLDRASQASPRGSILGFDIEDIAAGLGFDPADVDRIIEAMRAKGVLTADKIANWDRHQPKREDNSAAKRQHEKRARDGQAASRDVTQCHTASRSVTPRHTASHESREEERRAPEEPLSEGSSGAPPHVRAGAAERPAPHARPADETTAQRDELEAEHEGWKKLRQNLGEATWSAVFAACHISPNGRVIYAPSQAQRDHIESRFTTEIRRWVGNDVEIACVSNFTTPKNAA